MSHHHAGPVQKSGVLILSKRDPSRLLVLYRKREDDWTLPKGHVEPGEDAVQTALREAEEETGLKVRLFEGEEMPPLEYDYPEGGHVVVRMFVGRSEDDDALKSEFDGDRPEWVSIDDVPARLSYQNTREQFLAYEPRLRELISKL